MGLFFPHVSRNCLPSGELAKHCSGVLPWSGPFPVHGIAHASGGKAEDKVLGLSFAHVFRNSIPFGEAAKHHSGVMPWQPPPVHGIAHALGGISEKLVEFFLSLIHI